MRWFLNNFTASSQQKQKITGISMKIESASCFNCSVFWQHYLYHHRRIKAKKTQTTYIKHWKQSCKTDQGDSKVSRPQKWKFSMWCRIIKKEASECSEHCICGITLNPQDLTKWSSVSLSFSPITSCFTFQSFLLLSFVGFPWSTQIFQLQGRDKWDPRQCLPPELSFDTHPKTPSP